MKFSIQIRSYFEHIRFLIKVNSFRIADGVFPFVSGTNFHVKIANEKVENVNIRKAYWWIMLLIGRKVSPTIQLAIQLLVAETAAALPRDEESKSSDVKNQGMGPGPNANVTTNERMNKTFK